MRAIRTRTRGLTAVALIAVRPSSPVCAQRHRAVLGGAIFLNDQATWASEAPRVRMSLNRRRIHADGPAPRVSAMPWLSGPDQDARRAGSW
jgi:hypothetical protein